MGSTFIAGTWGKEARDFPPDRVTGARITRLSGSSVRTENIYCDAPRATADGRRFASQRYIDAFLSPAKALMCHDLKTKFTALLDREVRSVPISPAWGGSVYYLRGQRLMRASLEALTTQPVLEMGSLPLCWQPMSVSTDERFFLYTTLLQKSPEQYNLVRVDLRDKSWKLLFDKPEPSRCGGAFNPVAGHDLLISTTYWEGESRFGVGLLADENGNNAREVFRRVHHACWLGNTGQFAGLIEYDYERIAHQPEHPDGELYIYSSDGTPPRLIPVPEHLFYHISSSPCGKYVVCESLEHGLALGPVPIVVVNVVTGKHRVLVSDAKCSGGGDSGRQVNPYFMADMRHVIFNGDPDGVVNVFAAEIPAGFLESLN
jgi:hypothetical protein